jgi:D-serine deaminase-like pyridoxal phosphate-dependent protein
MSAVSTMPEACMIARDRVKTPALILDLEAMESNIAAMTDRARRLGVGLRAHAKSHKCVEIARRLAAAGALGPGCATIAEAEAMAAGGIGGILITSPMATDHALDRVRRMLLRGADVMLTADHPANVDALAALARAAGRRLPVIVDFDMGVGRTGCLEAPDAVALAQRISGHASLRFAGVQAYWGNLQQIMPLSEREARVAVQAARLKVLIDALTAAGLKPEIVTGAGTGTHWIDGRSGLFTEIQPGSFLFLDSCYDEPVPACALRRRRRGLRQPARPGDRQCRLEGVRHGFRKPGADARRADRGHLSLHGRRARCRGFHPRQRPGTRLGHRASRLALRSDRQSAYRLSRRPERDGDRRMADRRARLLNLPSETP